MARVSRKRKQEQAVEKLAVSRDEVYQCAVYIRLSKEENEKSDSHKLDNQEQVILNYVRKNSDLKIVKIYCDNGYSGTNFSRAAFGEMMQDIKSGIIRCVIVKDLSRLGRNHIETEQYIRTVFPFFNVRFIAVNDHFDSLHPEGDLMASLKNIINDAYAKDISRKIFTVKQNQRLKGEFVGNIPPYGYEKSVEDGHKLVINEETAPVIRKIFQLKEQKKTNTEIAKILEEEREIAPMKWSADSVRNILKSPAVIGSITNHRVERKEMGRAGLKKVNTEEQIIVENMHEPIIEKKIYDQIQKNYIQRNQKMYIPGEKIKRHLFSGILKCGCCGKNMVQEGGANRKYLCKYSREDNDELHRTVYIEENVLQEAMADFILVGLKLKISQKTEEKKSSRENTGGKRKTPSQSFHSKKKMLSDIYEAYAEGKIDKDTFLRKKENIREMFETEDVEAETKTAVVRTDLENLLEEVQSTADDSWLTREVLKVFVKEIWIFPESEMKIIWKPEWALEGAGKDSIGEKEK